MKKKNFIDKNKNFYFRLWNKKENVCSNEIIRNYNSEIISYLLKQW